MIDNKLIHFNQHDDEEIVEIHLWDANWFNVAHQTATAIL